MTAQPLQAARPRVLFVSHETTLSGAPIQLFHIVCWLREKDWRVVVAAPEEGPLADMLAARDVEMILENSLFTDPERRKAREICRGFDLVVANTIASWPAVRAAATEKIPVIWYLHEHRAALELMQLVPEMRPTLECADLLLTPTRQTARIYESLTRKPIEVVPYGIPARSCTQKPRDKRAFSFVLLGSYEARKGQDLVLEAVAGIPPDLRERFSVTMAGRPLDHVFYSQLQAKSASYPQVQLLTGVEHEEAERLLAQADVLLCASRDEAMPITILEAMSLGKLVVRTDVGGIHEWLRDGLNGFLVPAANPKALGAAMTRCVMETEVGAHLRRAAARTFQLHFSLDRFGRDFSALLLQTANRAHPSRVRDYGDWTIRYAASTPEARLVMRRQLRNLHARPLISIILPVFDPPLGALAAAVESVRAQSYGQWELCIADDASTDPEVRSLLERLAQEEPRAKLVFRARNGHISACSNSALALATGEWCALLDHDDALHEDALAWVAREIDHHPEAGLIYTDQDSIDPEDRRSNPFFKTDWDPLLFLGQNFINHLGVYRTDLLREIGGFREGFEGSQDYDLALRCLERLRPEQVRHVPRVLYHWRSVPGSIAGSSAAKPYAYTAARRALTDHLIRSNVAGKVEPCPQSSDSHRVVFEIAGELPAVSIIISTRDKPELLRRCIETLTQHTAYASRELLIVDNNSSEPGTHDLLRSVAKQGVARVLRDDGVFNFSRLNNLGAGEARGDFLLFLNNDIEIIEDGWLREMVSHAVQPGVGVVGARLIYPDGKLQHAGVILGFGGVAGHPYYKLPRAHPGYFNRAWLHHDCSAVTAACLLIRRSLFEELGGFDEKNLPIDFNDVDLCLRVRARGLRIVWTPYAELIHHESASRGRAREIAEVEKMLGDARYVQEKWGDVLLQDPFYTPNFSLALPGFELAFPPRV